ncbi:type II toxin-antitoxin system VapC family toxin [Candidatus Parcubacteria bacterium]|nr:type II toxin-antitoxin system VapC family toxin [Candidatus Parcubacteria bacterium]
MYFFDTNSIIYYFNGIQKMVEFFELLGNDNQEINLSVITKIELLSFENKNQIKNIEKLLANSNIFSLDHEVVDKTIEVRKKYKLKLPDAIIASTALVNNLILVTHNKKDFKKVDSLKIIDPLE